MAERTRVEERTRLVVLAAKQAAAGELLAKAALLGWELTWEALPTTPGEEKPPEVRFVMARDGATSRTVNVSSESAEGISSAIISLAASVIRSTP